MLRWYGSIVCLLICAFSMVTSEGLADTGLSITPTESDLSTTYLREFAADFFSKKCGIDKDIVMKARMSFDLWQSGPSLSEDKKSVLNPYHDPIWLIPIQFFPDFDHKYTHFMSLTREGELISWSAHGAEYDHENPDMMRMGISAIPLDTDATAEEIITMVKEDLASLHGVEVTERLSFQTAFIFHEFFNDGNAPVWLVNVYDNNTLAWKGVYGYNGKYMSLVEPQQDYQEYTTPGERFFYEVFGDEGMDISYDIYKGYVSEEESIAWLKKIAPAFELWIIEHPYYPDFSLVDDLLAKYADQIK